VVEVVDLRRIQVELVERDRDLVRVQMTGFTAGVEQRFCVIGLQNV
jgi:hypothetical protein